LSNSVISAFNQLEVGLVGLSPLGRGFLTGKITSIDDREPAEARRSLHCFQPEAIAAYLSIVEHVTSIAAELCATRLRSRSPGSAHTALPHIHTSWILGSSVVDPRRASDSGAGPSGVSDAASGGAQHVGDTALAPGLSGEPVSVG
jgi:hypothetical protein